MNDSTKETPGTIRPCPTITPAPLRISLAFFGVASAIFTSLIYWGIPQLLRLKVPWIDILLVVLTFPLSLMILAAFAGARLEGWELSWCALRERFRLQRMSGATWLWAIALAVFMYGGNLQLIVTGIIVLVAICIEYRGINRQSAGLAIGIGSFLVATWCMSLFSGPISRFRFYSPPSYVREFLDHFGVIDFMGIPPHGKWWIVPFYILALMVPNILGEELLWRGYLLPKQELVYGSRTWIVHGAMWALFHIFWVWTLWGLVSKFPTALALSFVCQRQRNTWPGIVGHAVGNSAFLITITRAVIWQ